MSLPEVPLPDARLEWVSPALLRILRCPLCKGGLVAEDRFLSCHACARRYPIVLGIPDLRVYEDPLIPLGDDYRKGEKIQVEAERLSFPDLVRFYWSLPTYPPTPPELAQRFIHHVLSDEARVDGYLPRIGSGGSMLEVGCGTAALLKRAAPRFEMAVGADVAFRWLLIARRRLAEPGKPANLVCCCADYLPFRAGEFQSVASVSLLEHVDDAQAAIAEFARVAGDRGTVFTWTTNRFSFAPEPHVRVWGVGFLPRRWMPAYVKWRSGLAYEKKTLLSIFELKRLLRHAGLRRVAFELPSVMPEDWERLSPLERIGARAFIWFSRLAWLRAVLTVIAPVILASARKAEADW